MARWPMARLNIGPVVAIQVSQDSSPVLFTASEDGTVAVLDGLTGRLRHAEKNLGQTPWLFLNP
jgi:methylamine dehydrogenase heavy chain